MPPLENNQNGSEDSAADSSAQCAEDLKGAPKIAGVEILELIGKGGMAAIYKARQSNLDRIVALKVLLDVQTEKDLARFQSEAKIGATLDHPNLVKIIGFGVSNDAKSYLLMEFLSGKSLASIIESKADLSLRQVSGIFLPLLDGLACAHKAGLVHRDIKPGNIMFCPAASQGDVVKLIDFGIAKYTGDESKQQRLTKTGALVGSPAYMSPEQCNGDTLDKRSDIYSLSCVLHELLCGSPPYESQSTLELMHLHASAPAPSAKELTKRYGLPPKLAALIEKGLAKNPANRFGTAEEFALEFRNAIDSRDLDLSILDLRKSKKKKLALLAKAGITAALLALVTAAAYLRLSGSDSKPNPNQSERQDLNKAWELISQASTASKSDQKQAYEKAHAAAQIYARYPDKTRELAKASYLALINGMDSPNGTTLLSSELLKHADQCLLLWQNDKQKKSEEYLACVENKALLLNKLKRRNEAADLILENSDLFMRAQNFRSDQLLLACSYVLDSDRKKQTLSLAEEYLELCKVDGSYKEKAGIQLRITFAFALWANGKQEQASMVCDDAFKDFSANSDIGERLEIITKFKGLYFRLGRGPDSLEKMLNSQMKYFDPESAYSITLPATQRIQIPAAYLDLARQFKSVGDKNKWQLYRNTALKWTEKLNLTKEEKSKILEDMAKN